MSDRRPPVFAAVIALVASLGLGAGVAVGGQSRSHADPTAETDGSTPATPVGRDVVVDAGQSFALAVGETAVIADGLQVRFGSVVGDSRCPADVTCVWEGNAEIALDVAMSGESPASLSLNTNARFATEATYLGYTIELLGLEPYPRTDSETDQPYRATLVASLTSVDATPALDTSPPAKSSDQPAD